MKEVIEGLKFVGKAMFEELFYRYSIFGFVFSALLTVTIGLLAGVISFDPAGAPYIHFNFVSNLWLPIVFVILFFSISITGYVLHFSTREDNLTPYRKMLVGTWQASFSTWYLDKTNLTFGQIGSICKISINKHDAKLEIVLSIRGSDLFENGDFPISSIHIDANSTPKRLILYNEFTYSLRPEHHAECGSTLTMPMVCVLGFTVNNDAITRMDGYWYDIENKIFDVLSKIDDNIDLSKMRERLNDGRTTLRADVDFIKA